MGCSGTRLANVYAKDNLKNVPVGLKYSRGEKYCCRILAEYFDAMAICGHVEENAFKRMKNNDVQSIRKITHSVWSPLEWLQNNYK